LNQRIKKDLEFEIQSHLKEFDWNFQGLMKFEPEAPVCTWMTTQLIKKEFDISN
jgi:hypothetical protein